MYGVYQLKASLERKSRYQYNLKNVNQINNIICEFKNFIKLKID